MARQFTLGKNERLKSRKTIEQLFSNGKSIAATGFRVLYLLENKSAQKETGSPLQAGFSVSSRNFKKAVERNRIRRWIKESYRLQKLELKELLATNNKEMALFLIYTAKDMPVHDFVKESIGMILKKLQQRVNESTRTNT